MRRCRYTLNRDFDLCICLVLVQMVDRYALIDRGLIDPRSKEVLGFAVEQGREINHAVFSLDRIVKAWAASTRVWRGRKTSHAFARLLSSDQPIDLTVC